MVFCRGANRQKNGEITDSHFQLFSELFFKRSDIAAGISKKDFPGNPRPESISLNKGCPWILCYNLDSLGEK
jgi:hypothetical protein